MEKNNSLINYTPNSVTEEPPKEFWEFLSQIGFKNLHLTKSFHAEAPQALSEEAWLKPLLIAGKAKLYSLEGKLLKAKHYFERAGTLLQNVNDYPDFIQKSECNAYIHYEYGVFYRKIGDYLSAKNLFDSGLNLTKMKRLSQAFRYQLEILAIEMKQTDDLSKLEILTTELLKSDMNILVSIGYYTMGVQSVRQNKYKQAHHYYDLASQISVKNNLDYNNMNVSNALGYLLYLEKNYQKASEIFNKILPEIPSYFLKAIVLENQALVLEKLGQQELALQKVEQAFYLSMEHDIITQIPGQCIYLGDIYSSNRFNDLKKALYYYRLGYEKSLFYQSEGIRLTGDRFKAVTTYVNFLENHPSIAGQISTLDTQFEFALGKPWKKIKDLFHYNLIVYHRLHAGKTSAILNILQIPPTTLYSLQERLRKRGVMIPKFITKESPLLKDFYVEPLQDYISEKEELSWTEVNRVFEREMMHFLYEKYGYNKQRMAKVLELSYSVVITKTRSITEPTMHYLTA